MKRVLVVEDSATMRSAIVETLGDLADCRVDEAENGFAAIRALSAGEYDLVLTDLNMPEMNGLEVVNFVRHHPTLAKIPLLVLSTENRSQDIRKAMELGATEYLTKPFNPEDLLNRVRALLGGRA